MAEETEKQLRYEGHFLMDSGLKVYFDISAENGGEKYDSLYGDCEFRWGQGEIIYITQDEGKAFYILADKVIGFVISEYNEEL